MTPFTLSSDKLEAKITEDLLSGSTDNVPFYQFLLFFHYSDETSYHFNITFHSRDILYKYINYYFSNHPEKSFRIYSPFTRHHIPKTIERRIIIPGRSSTFRGLDMDLLIIDNYDCIHQKPELLSTIRPNIKYITITTDPI